MKVVIATPILYDSTSPFNHLFKDIIGGFLDAGYEVERHVAVRDDSEDGYKYGYENVEYKKYQRKESAHGNIITRYIRDTLTNIREARGIKKSGADVLFEDVSYSSFWSVRAAKKKGMRVVAMLQDVWPDNAVQSGLIKNNGLLYRYFESWQRYVYKHADKIICISDDMKDFIASKGVDEKKIDVIYNWGYSDETVNISWEDNEFVKKYQLEKDFYAVYAGNIGKMQNVELVVQAAKKMPDTKFLIIGDGANVTQVKTIASDLKNITFYPFQPSELAVHIYSAAGVNIIPLVTNGIKTALPSKTGVVLSCGKSTLFCFGNGTKFEKRFGQYSNVFVCSSHDASEIVERIKTIKTMSSRADYTAFTESFKSTNVKSYTQSITKAMQKVEE